MDLSEYAVNETSLEFLKQKEDEGNLIIQTAQKSTTGEAASYTPATGKTFYFYMAEMRQDSSGNNPVESQVENNGTAIRYMKTQINTTNNVYRLVDRVQGPPDSLVGDGAKKFRINITANSDSEEVETVLIGWIEDT